MATWFRRGRGTALGILVGALTLGSATPHLVNALGGLDWRTVVYATSALTLAGGLTRAGGARRPVPVPAGDVRPAPGAPGLRQPRRSPREPRLLRPHVGALRDVGVVRRLLLDRRSTSGAAAAYATFAVIAAGAARLLGRRRSRRSDRSPGDDRARHGGVRGLRARDRALPGRSCVGRARRRDWSGASPSWPTRRSSRPLSPSTPTRPTSVRR